MVKPFQSTNKEPESKFEVVPQVTIAKDTDIVSQNGLEKEKKVSVVFLGILKRFPLILIR